MATEPGATSLTGSGHSKVFAVFDLINTVMGMFKAKAAVSAVRLGEAADDHIWAAGIIWTGSGSKVGLSGWPRRPGAARTAAWERLPSQERDAILARCDDPNAQGRLEDHPYFDQWLALRMEGCGGD